MYRLRRYCKAFLRWGGRQTGVGGKTSRFYPRDAMLARVIAIATCLSVCPSVRLSVRHAPVLCQNEES